MNRTILADGRRERVAFDKITSRINKLCYGLDMNFIDPAEVAQKVVQGVYQGVTTVELDNLAAETAAYLTTKHPDYALLAARIAVSNLHKETKKQFSAVIEDLYNYVNPKNGLHSPMISEETLACVRRYADRLNSAIIYDRDFNYNYFGFKTLERSYLLRINKKTAERPQHMLMRVAVGIHGDDVDAAIETYNLMSEKFFTHASPTLFNAGTPHPQMSSCFLLTIESDSIEGIYSTLKTCAMISKTAGGIGLNVHKIRAVGSYIAGTNGLSNGIIPMLRVFNNTARYVDQGGNKRPGAFAIYLEPWHADIFEFLDLKKNTGKEENRARDLFYGLWIPDLFMRRVEENGDWNLFCPAEAPGLDDAWGEAFDALYAKYEAEGRARKIVKAQKLWFAILDAQSETGTPYMLYKDSCNRKSNQQNLGTIKCSNLCCIAADQRVPTAKGMLTVGELFQEGTENVVVGRTKIETASKMLLPRPNAPMVKIMTAEGYSHKVTPDHKVWVHQVGWKMAEELQPNDKISIQQIEGLFGSLDMQDEALLIGYATCEGTFSDGMCSIDVWDHTLPMRETLESAVHRVITKYDGQLDYDAMIGSSDFEKTKPTRRPKFALRDSAGSGVVYRLSSPILFHIFASLGFGKDSQFKVPDVVWRGTKTTVSKYLEGLYLADATVYAADRACTLSLASKHISWLEDIQIVWANFGVKSVLTKACDDTECTSSRHICGSNFHLTIASVKGCQIAESITHVAQHRGDECKSFLEELQADADSQEMWCTFVGLEALPNEDAFCLAVDSIEHSWTVNGIVTKNTEIVEYSAPDEVAVCNLASLALPTFVIKDPVRGTFFDFDKLIEVRLASIETNDILVLQLISPNYIPQVTKIVTRNLNKVIDINYYPVPEAKRSNMRHRPIGLGVQGLADAFIKMRMPFDSAEAKALNRQIFEAIYFAALTSSCEIAQRDGPYETYEGSPASKGQLQPDLWNVKVSDQFDWPTLRAKIAQHGLRNSLLVAPMPTASTSQIMGFNEAFEPYTSNIYTRRVLSGEFQIVNQHLLKDLTELGLWNESMKNRIIANNGSVQNIASIPDELKAIYKTVWELSQKTIIDMAADRGAFIDQSQSLNIHMAEVNYGKLTSMHFHGWRRGLKTGMYYLRTRPAADAIKFTVDRQAIKNEDANAAATAASLTTPASSQATADSNLAAMACSLENRDACLSCSG
eukprot:jgi/Hompol1/1546/HPOL_002736-RA